MHLDFLLWYCILQFSIYNIHSFNPTLFIFIYIEQNFKFKGRDRLDMVVELKVQYCREKL